MDSSKATELPENPRETANPLSNLFFCYTMPVFFKGRKKELVPSDLYKALKEHKSSTLGDKLCAAWENELKRAEAKGKSPSLLRATIRVFGLQIVLLGIILLILEFCIKVTQPLFLGSLVAFYSKPGGNITEAYLYAAAVILCSALNVAFVHPFMLSQVHCGMKLRVSMISMIYRKALRLSKTALGNTTAGQIVNLLSNDVGRLDLSMIFLHHLWVGPAETILVLYLMYEQIGVSAVAGVVFMLLFIPLQGYLGKKTSVLRLKTAIRTDERVRLMNEIVQGIQVIKMYAWEKPFGRLVALAREREIKMIRYTSYIRGVILSFIIFVTRVSIFMSLIVYALLGYHVSADKAFVIIAYYNILRQTMTVFFPQGISQLAETLVSLKRIEAYMLYAETQVKSPDDDKVVLEDNYETLTDKDTNGDQKIIHNGNKNNEQPIEEAHLELHEVVAKWDPDVAENTLDGISFTAKPGELVAVIGPVGAGKSSLIQILLGELPLDSGKTYIKGVVSYASQEPWLFTGTVRQNILFGQPMDRKRYKMVVKKCALERDFELLPFGDRTIVGERGASLSGGQKARISLARAVYRKAGIYLLDDPLSAVDTHVGKHLFEQCMREYLRDHIVILVTHQLQFLQQADKIIILEHGKVSAIGTYSELKESGLDFANLLAEPDKVETLDERVPSVNKLHQRQNSESSVNSAEEQQVVDTQMQVQEMQQFGSIGLSLYKKYFQAGGGMLLFCILTILCVGTQLLASGGDYFVSYWVDKEAARDVVNSTSTSGVNQTQIESSADSENMTDIYIFSAIIVGTVIVTLARSFLFFSVAMTSSINLHNHMYRGVTRATMYFFNTNPSGRILNRFSKDMGQVDEILPSVMMDVIQIFLSLAGIVVVVVVVNVWFLIPTVIMGVIFYNLRNFYLQTSRNIKRMEAVTRSPIFSHLSASLNGLSTIRTFGAQKVLINEFDNLQDSHSSVFFAFISTSRAFGFWLDCICVIYIATVTLSFFIMGNENGGSVGLAITQALGMTGMVQWGMRQSAELENTMTAVERVVEYETIEEEGALEAPAEKKPPKEWPNKGHIKFDHLYLRYFPDPDSDVVLKDLQIEIMPKEKIGIVGRTGAGKSSLINALFRLSYTEGAVLLDGIDTGEIGLHDLRTKISIIPQEPVLFSGSMRYNLDPFDEYSDAKLWQVLAEVKLKDVVTDLPFGLQSKISEGGSNFSVGQRQLVCLARAILRENKILVMDEATANVDPQTDALIQTTIREKFDNCTVLTIAHRLHTVMDSDKVLVMDAGKAVEFNAPYLLLTASEKQIFLGMAQQTGKATFNNLLKIAKAAYEANEAKKATDDADLKEKLN
ncbi:probable multidrug resistance-associated protein lethal(2)03659 [Hermetia illucens]|uniref:probable multidrug resistance-associated protein lethal(2)03659 n=1 Tax=Hermetia illucens TaxID=343691 RepID=UPI0018CC413F|nr:probable multidrug resistance-associated protein lethal(2)03659 [Hermetia illucens]XP_037923053.1 probable multidrug resistance-associated protein lethal(2)03659 [Hermetia illucens]